jgi:hypothetical protein
VIAGVELGGEHKWSLNVKSIGGARSVDGSESPTYRERFVVGEQCS